MKFCGNQSRNFKKCCKNFDEISWKTERTTEKKKLGT